MPVEIPVSVDKLRSIADIYGTPFQLYDEEMIRRNAKKYLQTFRKEFSNFKQFFAVKALPNPNILKILHEEGFGFDCSGWTEIHLCKMIGARGEDIMFTSNYTSVEDLKYAVENNVIINLDDIDVFNNLLETKIKLPDIISFRLNPEIGKTDSEVESNVLGGKNSKFGIPISDIVTAYKTAQKYGIKKFGIHIMTGSCVMDVYYWNELVEIVFKTIRKINDDIGIKFEFVNLGGGLGIPYKPEVHPIDLDKLVNIIKTSVDNCKEKYKIDYDPILMTENGRYITGPYGWLVAECKAIKSAFGSKYYGLDASMANLMRPGMYGAYHHITIPRISDKINFYDECKTEKSSVVGQLCENSDFFAKDRNLPIEITKGDLFVIHDTGAHGQSMCYQYNGKLRCPELLLTVSGDIKLIRKRETVDDLTNNVIMI